MSSEGRPLADLYASESEMNADLYLQIIQCGDKYSQKYFIVKSKNVLKRSQCNISTVSTWVKKIKNRTRDFRSPPSPHRPHGTELTGGQDEALLADPDLHVVNVGVRHLRLQRAVVGAETHDRVLFVGDDHGRRRLGRRRPDDDRRPAAVDAVDAVLLLPEQVVRVLAVLTHPGALTPRQVDRVLVKAGLDGRRAEPVYEAVVVVGEVLVVEEGPVHRVQVAAIAEQLLHVAGGADGWKRIVVCQSGLRCAYSL